MISSSSNPQRGRRQIEFFSGNRRKSPYSPRDLDELVARLRGLSNIEVVTGPVGKFILGDEKCLLVIPPSSAGMNPRLEYDPTATYKYFDLVFISRGSNQGTFLYINKSSSLGSDHPPYAGGNYWVEFPSNNGNFV